MTVFACKSKKTRRQSGSSIFAPLSPPPLPVHDPTTGGDRDLNGRLVIAFVERDRPRESFIDETHSLSLSLVLSFYDFNNRLSTKFLCYYCVDANVMCTKMIQMIFLFLSLASF